jgi:hypothetical protein
VSESKAFLRLQSSLEHVRTLAGDAVHGDLAQAFRLEAETYTMALEEITRLKAIVSDLVKAAEPFVRTANNYRARDPNYIGFGRSGTGYKDFDLGDLRALSSTVRKAKETVGKDTP